METLKHFNAPIHRARWYESSRQHQPVRRSEQPSASTAYDEHEPAIFRHDRSVHLTNAADSARPGLLTCTPIKSRDHSTAANHDEMVVIQREQPRNFVIFIA